MKVVIFFVKLLILGALFIVSNEELHLSEEGNMAIFGEMYFQWLGSLIDSGKSITGFVIDVEWLPRIDSDPSLNPPPPN